MTSELERWLRTDFVVVNTELEDTYFAARSEIRYDSDLAERKQKILRGGAEILGRISDVPADPEGQYQLLGAVGLYLAACRRHEVGDADTLSGAWAVANRLGAALGVAPRMVFAHMSLHNPAVVDTSRRFTSLEDEYVFVTYNALAVLAYQRAAAALRRVPVFGVTSPLTTYELTGAKTALEDVLTFNRTLAAKLDVDRFFYNVRPYYKPHLVGKLEHRGTNAGDFAAVSEIDLVLGLCAADDPFYQSVLAEKYPYLPPEDQAPLRAAVTGPSLLEAFLREDLTPQLRQNAELYLEICRAHGAAYAYHHHRLVIPFLEEPARTAPPERLTNLTGSGPPLEVVVASLSRLSDLRAARARPGLRTAHDSLAKLRQRLAP